MGRSRAIRYTVDMKIVDGFTTPGEYRTKYYGRASAKGLEAYVTSYNESLKPGGVNAHIGETGRCYRAVLKDYGTVVAEWSAPMFEVV